MLRDSCCISPGVEADLLSGQAGGAGSCRTRRREADPPKGAPWGNLAELASGRRKLAGLMAQSAEASRSPRAFRALDVDCIQVVVLGIPTFFELHSFPFGEGFEVHAVEGRAVKEQIQLAGRLNETEPTSVHELDDLALFHYRPRKSLARNGWGPARVAAG